MTLRTRLALGLVLIATILVIPLLVARNSLHRLHGQVRSLREGEFQASLVLGRLRDALGELRASEVALGVLQNDAAHAHVVSALHRAEALADSLERATRDSAVHRLRADLDAASPGVEREYAAMRGGRTGLADTVSQNLVSPALRDADRQLPPAELLLRSRTRERVMDAEATVGEAQRMTLVALAVALALAALIAFWLTRSINRPVVALESGMRAVADGDLEHTLDIRAGRGDEFGRLATSFQDMSRQLAELDKLKAEFVSIASHELKTPINVILGYLALMQEGVYGPLSDKQLPVTKTIEAQARTLARLASQLLDVSRFEAGGGRIDPRPVHLSTMLDELERTFHVLAVQRDIDLRVVRRPGLPTDVVWDVERINEVTGNLLSNAFKFTPAGGTIELIAAPAGDRVSITVRDTGAGIAADQLPHVFEKFYQADNQKSATAKGTGLGLAIAREIVTAHNGSITCESEVGSGTTFRIELPVSVENRRRTGAVRIPQEISA